MPRRPAPETPRAVAYFDGQNLFKTAQHLFGHATPNYDVVALSRLVCAMRGWELAGVRFYTGIPRDEKSEVARVLGIQTAPHGAARRENRRAGIALPPDPGRRRTGREKGVDVRIAVDIIRGALHKEYDVALVFSQDQDLSEAAKEIPVIAREQGRWIRIASAFPHKKAKSKREKKAVRGVNNTEWIKITRADYDACLDPRDHFSRPKKSARSVRSSRSVPPRREAA